MELIREKIEDFVKNGFLEFENREKKNFLRLSEPVDVIITESCVEELKNSYNSKLETGGVLLGKPKIGSDSNRVLVFDHYKDIPNKSATPHRSYSPFRTQADYSNYQETVCETIRSGCLPFRLHSHPTYGANFHQERARFLKQLDTSPRDQVTTLLMHNLKDMSIKLPDILLVGNGSNKNSIFIGFYGGGMCPPNFEKQKRLILEKSMNNFMNDVNDWANTSEKQLLLGIGGAALLFLSVSNPKIAVSALAAGAVTIPSIIYEFQDSPNYFGVTSSKELKISIPGLEESEIKQYYKDIEELRIKLDGYS